MFAIRPEELELAKRTHLNNITKSNSVMIGDGLGTSSPGKGLGVLSAIMNSKTIVSTDSSSSC